MAKTINEILSKYYEEADGGMVDKTPSTLNRGEGTETEFYIMKIDLSGSTKFLYRRSPQTYLKIAHIFLSSVDEITRLYRADSNQAEYAGDSVIAYFRASDVEPEDVLFAAYYCRRAALEMQNLDVTLKQYHFKTKVVLHFGKLIMAKIGPWGDGRISAIGFELHRACKMEQNVSAGQGKATKEFWAKLKPINRKFLSANTRQVSVEIPQPPAGSSLMPFNFGLRDYAIPPSNALSAGLGNLLSPQKPRYELKTEVVDYTINWNVIEQYFKGRG
ncbi:MAG: adenylate cyclase [Nitrospirota bacterium]